MSRPPILVTRRIPSSIRARLEEACEVDLHDRGDLPYNDLLSRVEGKQGVLAVVTDALDRAVIEAGRDLKVISTIAVGYNNIDVAAARARGIVVTNTPDILTESTADLTWSLILGIMRRVVEGDRLVRRGQWKGFALDFMLGSDLHGKQLGIVGFGRIGRAVAARAPAFGMRVAYAARSASPAAPALVSPVSGSPIAAEGMPLDRLLSTSDIVSLHCPLTAETKHLINQTTLMRMKRGAYLISAARGPIVDESALVWALENRVIAGAALDVYEREPEIHPKLPSFENVVLSPHLGSSAIETRTAMIDLAARNVLAVLAGEPAITPI
ncbi:MAG TPA: D-glycerate dehydrogenase [Vicinamibacterales bacterium]|nr:D-glycerate dehydrogenase [Vicinamibacterales bacterium]